MRGKVLAFDAKSGSGHISGDDGQRYAFNRRDWRTDLAPGSGQIVDFEAQGNQAVELFRVPGSVANSGGKNKIVAALLAFFLGGLGIHKFYLGKNGAGLTMLLISVFGAILLFIPTLIIGLIAFIEFIIYLVKSDEDFERDYVVGDKAWF